MNTISYYIVDVFANAKYEGNQLAVFLDLTNQLSNDTMQQIAREINFAETTFIKAVKSDKRFVVKIFTPEHEVPFAGHPSLGTSYIIAKFLAATVKDSLTLELSQGDVPIRIEEPNQLEQSLFYMRQAQPQFGDLFDKRAIAESLGIPVDAIDPNLPIQEISTGLPYILIPVKDLAAINRIELSYQPFKDFLLANNKYRINSPTGHSTSLFFFTNETHHPANDYNARMLLIENNKVSEDAATGSANGCLLAYLLTYVGTKINAVVEQGFQLHRPSYIYLDGELTDNQYSINVGGRNQLVSSGSWYK